MRPKKCRLGAITFALLLGLLVVVVIGLHNSLFGPVKRAADVRLGALPAGTKPVRIALLSDIHVGNLVMRPKRLSSIVSAVNNAHPDIVLLAGDFVIGEKSAGTAERARDLAPLAELRAPGGVFAVLGNHDNWTDPEAIRVNLRRAGVIVLENEALRRGPITIVGIGDRFSHHDNIARSVLRASALGGMPIVLTHSPDLVPDLPAQMSVVFAGHTHCGQMVVPLIGPIVRYSHWRRLYDPKYQCGPIKESHGLTIVTAGIGSGELPLRFNTTPDWWLIELRPLMITNRRDRTDS